jgi:CheY-like chemotaxis protein
LLITDVRLPGLTGIELVRAAWEVRPDLPVIMITAYSLSEVDEEVASLGVGNYFRKPLDAEDFLDAVFAAIEKPEQASKQAEGKRPAYLKPPDSVADRLDMLRTDTGARQAVLATMQGELLYVSGPEPDFDLAQILDSISTILATSLGLASDLEQKAPLSVQFLSGDSLDSYITNIDSDYFIAMFIDARARRGRIGSLWVFTQRAVKDIRDLLKEQPAEFVEEPFQPGMVKATEPQATDADEALSAALTLEEEFLPAGEGPTYEQLDEPVILPADEESESDRRHAPLEDDQFESLLDKIDADEQLDADSGEALDAFWNEASDADHPDAASGLTLDEARKQGLITPKFDEDEE